VPQAAIGAEAPANPAPAGTGTGTLIFNVIGGFADITIVGHPPVLAQKHVASATLPAGRYTVRFDHAGFDPVTRTVTVVAGQDVRVPVTMHQAGRP
jgi:hypothetical protein